MSVIPGILITIVVMAILTVVILTSGGSVGDAALIDGACIVGSSMGAYVTRDDWR